MVFTNGCFDILHVGHVRYLEAARSEGDLLVVGLNTDASVQAIKGPRRPIVNQDQRAEVLAALGCVDFVVLFDEPDPLRLIETLKPDVLVKGADWSEENIIGAEVVKASGGRVVRIELVPAVSTTGIIGKILETYQGS
ncbi:MAG: D-glycero-beta-D-manno-heptose 1-phosphate adenylyltransferase [Planctomycetales bacterium]|nr:D-glycero-beta-D-manno-heptose 1-phosphate adenylyltransferase [Planctomycetales bacterium]